MCCLNDLYNTRAGRLVLFPLISKPVSDLAGFLMDCRISVLLIKPFVKKNHIVLDDYELDDIRCFNDFFYRKIRKGLRQVSDIPSELVAPCDGLLKVSRINRGSIIEAKQSRFTIRGLLRDLRLADSFEGGYCFVYRLCVDDYHRYVYFDSGKKYRNRHIRGVYHTVRPVALDAFPVFVQNTFSVTSTHSLFTTTTGEGTMSSLPITAAAMAHTAIQKTAAAALSIIGCIFLFGLRPVVANYQPLDVFLNL